MAFEGLLSVVIPVYRSEGYLAARCRSSLTFFEPGARSRLSWSTTARRTACERHRRAVRGRPARPLGQLGRNVGQHRATLRGFAMARGDVS